MKVAETGTYLAASKVLALAQPALWRRVKDLERELGTILFERTGRRVRLTAAGRRLVIEADRILAACTRLERTAEDLRSARLGTVSIACAAPHLRMFLAGAIAQLRRERPGIGIEIREYGGGSPPGEGTVEDLVAGRVDLASGVAPREGGRFDGFQIYKVRLMVALPDRHPWRRRRLIDVGSLQGKPLICAQSSSYSRRAIVAACARAGFVPEIAFDSHSPLSLVALGSAHLGIPIFADDALPHPPGNPWPSLAEHGRPITDVVSLVWRADLPLPPAAARFVEVARKLASKRGRARR